MATPWFASGAVALAAFGAYLATLCPTVAPGDSGELAAAAKGLGVAHPPGYPLYTLLGHVFTWFRWGSVAQRVNLMSASASAGATFFLALAAQRLTGAGSAALLAGGLFAFSPIVWETATVAEVFPLSHLLVAAFLWVAACEATADPREGGSQETADRARRQRLWAGALLAGLGIANHHTSVFLTLPVLGWLAWRAKHRMDPRDWIRLVGSFLAGLLPYLYLPISDSRNPPFSWGNPSTLPGFFKHVLRREYGTLSLGPEFSFGQAGDWAPRVGDFLSGYWVDSLYAGAVLAAVTLAVLAFRAWPRVAAFFAEQDHRARVDPRADFIALVAGCAALYVLVFSGLSNLARGNPLYPAVQNRFWQQGELALALVAAYSLRLAPTWLRGATGTIVAGVVVATSAAWHFRDADRSEDRSAFAYAKSIMDSLPEGAVLLSHGDLMTNTVRYLQYAEKYRPDIRVLDRELMATPWYARQVLSHFPEIQYPGKYFRIREADGFNLLKLLDANPTKRFFFASFDPFEGDRSFQERYATVPWGFVHRASLKTEGLDLPGYLQGLRGAWAAFDGATLERLRGYGRRTWQASIWREYWESHYRAGTSLIEFGYGNGDHPEALRAGIAMLEDLAERNRAESPAWLYKHLGLAGIKLAGKLKGPEAISRRDRAKEALRAYLSRVSPAQEPELESLKGLAE